ncbi:Cytochrome P450 52A9 [Candida maltosa Xu316]|uniref:Cytochrome P450 52A9 n=1 Tax=Candida maltosa (strain Xu316) TaxID=1245528 RepID=M3IU34_CANMX|nr:Cytochrome P450 52A9 [Candida maltosa Xu316]
MIDEILPKLVQYWYIVLPTLLIIKHVVSYINTQRLMRKFKAKPVTNVLNDGFFGIPNGIKAIKEKNKGRAQEYNDEKFAAGPKPKVGTYLSKLFTKDVLVTKDPENIKAILATQFEDFSLGKRLDFFKPLLGYGIFTLDGEGWKHSRAMLRPQFAREQVGHVKLIEPHFQSLKKHIIKNKGQFFDIQELFFRFTVDSATEFLFGESVESLKDESIGYDQQDFDFDGRRNFAEAFNKAQEYLGTRAILQSFYWLVNGAEFKKSVAEVHKFTDYYVQKALDATPEELEKHSGYIFLYELVQQTRDPKVLRDQSLNILLAGRDTTAGLLSFALFELSRNPEVWSRLREEIGDKFGLDEDATIEGISFESLKQCEYLKAVVNECLRMYPSVPRNFRIATKHTTLPRGGGPDGKDPIFIKKGAVVSYGINSTHLDPMYYGPDARLFNPDRWSKPETKKLGWAFLPFNGGPRICLGQQFALTEASYVLVRMVQNFKELELIPNTVYPPRRLTNLTMSLYDGAYIKVN